MRLPPPASGRAYASFVVHPVAAEGFADAARYERGRPDYAPDAVDWLVEAMGLEAGDLIADVAAGTGKLTRALRARHLQVVPVEPLSPMLEPLVTTHPSPVMAVAELLPFADGSLTGITVGQAMHWFDKERSAAEFRRVLRPGGRLGLMWNARERALPYMDELWSIMDAVEKRAPWRNHDKPITHHVPGFGPATHRQFSSRHAVDRSAVHDRFLSVSHVAALDDRRRAEVVEEIDRVLDRHFGERSDRFELSYLVDAYWLEPLS